MNMLLRSLMLTTAAFAPGAAHASEPLFAATPLTDTELDQARGGFSILGGVNFDIGAVVSTTIDGVKVLTSQLNVNNLTGVKGSVETSSSVQSTVSGSGAGSITQTITQAVDQTVKEVTTAVGNLTESLSGGTPAGGETPATTSATTASTSANAGIIAPTTPIAEANVPTTVVENVVTAATNLAENVGTQATNAITPAVQAANGALAEASDNVAVSASSTGPLNPVTTAATPDGSLAATTSSVSPTSAPSVVTPAAVPEVVAAVVTAPVVAAAETITQAVTAAVPQTATPTSQATVTSTTSATTPPINVPAATTTVNGTDYLTSTVQMTDLLVRHSLGNGISSLVANTGDNRIIDTQVAVNLRLDNVQPLSLGSIGFDIANIGLDAAQLRAR